MKKKKRHKFWAHIMYSMKIGSKRNKYSPERGKRSNHINDDVAEKMKVKLWVKNTFCIHSDVYDTYTLNETQLCYYTSTRFIYTEHNFCVESISAYTHIASYIYVFMFIKSQRSYEKFFYIYWSFKDQGGNRFPIMVSEQHFCCCRTYVDSGWLPNLVTTKHNIHTHYINSVETTGTAENNPNAEEKKNSTE